MPSHRPPTARRALLCALVVLAASQPAAQARTPPRPFIELGLGAGGGPDNFGWRAHIAIGELSSHPLGRRWEVAVGRFGAGRGCPTDAGFNCGRGFAWVVSGSVLGGYRPTRSARGPFLLFGPGLSYSNGSAYRASGVHRHSRPGSAWLPRRSAVRSSWSRDVSWPTAFGATMSPSSRSASGFASSGASDLPPGVWRG